MAKQGTVNENPENEKDLPTEAVENSKEESSEVTEAVETDNIGVVAQMLVDGKEKEEMMSELGVSGEELEALILKATGNEKPESEESAKKKREEAAKKAAEAALKATEAKKKANIAKRKKQAELAEKGYFELDDKVESIVEDLKALKEKTSDALGMSRGLPNNPHRSMLRRIDADLNQHMRLIKRRAEIVVRNQAALDRIKAHKEAEAKKAKKENKKK